MSRIKNTSEVPTYDEPAKPNIRVHSHWNRSAFVELEVNGERTVVVGSDLIKAINNCMNVGV